MTLYVHEFGPFSGKKILGAIRDSITKRHAYVIGHPPKAESHFEGVSKSTIDIGKKGHRWGVGNGQTTILELTFGS